MHQAQWDQRTNTAESGEVHRIALDWQLRFCWGAASPGNQTTPAYVESQYNFPDRFSFPCAVRTSIGQTESHGSKTLVHCEEATINHSRKYDFCMPGFSDSDACESNMADLRATLASVGRLYSNPVRTRQANTHVKHAQASSYKNSCWGHGIIILSRLSMPCWICVVTMKGSWWLHTEAALNFNRKVATVLELRIFKII